MEIVFDNADNRFPTGREEVVLRRTIGLKKDEYSLDHKVITKADLMNLLQAAGFSRSNPYYIVPQGRITALCNAKDSDRLGLLKEVAGTRVYEEHRAESVKILEETERKRERIVELLAMIEERLKELEEEKEELEGFLAVDKDRKAIEYTIWSRQLDQVNREIAELERQAIQQDGSFEEKLAHLNRLEQDLADQEEAREEALREREMLEHEREDYLRQMANLEIADAGKPGDQVKVIEQEMHVNDQRIRELEGNIIERESKIKDLASERDRLQGDMERIEAQLQTCKSKQSRSSQFKTIAERDKYLRQEIQALNTTLPLQGLVLGRQLAQRLFQGGYFLLQTD